MGVFVKTAEDGWLNLETGANRENRGRADGLTGRPSLARASPGMSTRMLKVLSGSLLSSPATDVSPLRATVWWSCCWLRLLVRRAVALLAVRAAVCWLVFRRCQRERRRLSWETKLFRLSLVHHRRGTISWIGVFGDWSNPPNTGNGGMDLSGNGVNSRLKDGTQIGYGGGSAATADYGQGNPPRANSGGACTNTDSVQFGADGVCIVRVPKGNDIDATVAPCTTSIRSKAHEAIVKKASE